MKVKVHLPKEYILAHLLKHSFFFFGVGQRGTKLLKVTFAFFFFFFPCNYTKQQTRDSGQSVVKYLCGASLHNIRLSIFECPVIL